MLKSSLCDYSDAYILVKGTIAVNNTAAAGAAVNNTNKKVKFKNCASFTNCISEINNTQINNAKGIDIVMPMYNLIEYSDNYAKTTGSLWQYCKDIPSRDANDGDIVIFADGNTTDSFKFKLKITGRTGNGGTKDVEIMVPLKYLSNFWRTLEMPLINCEVNLILAWPSSCVLIATSIPNQNATFTINETKLYVPVVPLSTQENTKLLQQFKSGSKRVINWNKYLSKPELLAQNPNLNHLVEPSFQGKNRLFVLAFENDNDRTSDDQYYLPTVEIKDYNIVINGENFFDQPIKNNKITYDNIRKIATGQGDDYTTGCLLDYPYFADTYKMIAGDLNKQQALDADPRAIQQINFTANLDRAGNTRVYFILEEAKETIFNLIYIKMTQYNSLNVKLLNSQLNKLKSSIKNENDVVLTVTSNMVSNSNDNTNFPHELLLTNRQVANIRKAFAKNTSIDIKLSKTQLSKMIQSRGSLGNLLGKLAGPLMKVAMSLAKNVLAPLGISAAMSAIDGSIKKKMLASGTTILIISNDEMDDILKIVKSLEDSGLLLKGVSETIQHEAKEQRGGFLSMLLGILGASLLGDILSGKGVIRAGEGTIRAGYGSKRPSLKNF